MSADAATEPEPELAALPGWGRFGNPAGAIYGTIVTAGVLAAQGEGRDGVWVALTSALVTLVVFWLAHAYTDLLGQQIESGVTQAHPFVDVLLEELPIVEALAAPAVAVIISKFLGAEAATAITAGLATCVAELIAWTLLAAHRLRLGARRTVAYVLVTSLLGVGLMALKVVLH